MIKDFIYMNGYGIFVWLSFFITFVVCGVVYLKTYKTLKKYEKEFASEIQELEKGSEQKISTLKKISSDKLNEQIEKRKLVSESKIDQLLRDANLSIKNYDFGCHHL